MGTNLAFAQKLSRTKAMLEGEIAKRGDMEKHFFHASSGADSSNTMQGWISTRGGRASIEVRYASMHSLWTELGLDFGFGDIENLELSVGDHAIQIGPCYAAHKSERAGATFRLIPFSKIINFQKLFAKAKVEAMDTKLSNLSFALGNRAGVDPLFKGFVSDLTYELNTYVALLDGLDDECIGESSLVRDTVQANIIENTRQGFSERLDSKNRELTALVSGLDEEEQERYGRYFRAQLWNIILRSPILSRTNLKPRGYAGDSEMMRMIYLADHQGDSTFGKLLHMYSISRPAAQAVRNRRAAIGSLLSDRLEKAGTANDGRVRVLSVACGPAFEILDILKTKADCERLHIVFLDQDPQALIEASAMISEREKAIGTKISAEFVKESVRTMFVDARMESRLGSFDFIYSMGLFDYLNARAATAVIKHLYTPLNPGGEMVIGNMAANNPNRHFMEFWHDWKLIGRSEEDFLKLIPGLSGAEANVDFDETGIQMMLHIRKNA